MRISSRSILIGSLILVIQFGGFLFVLASAWSIEGQAVFSLTLFAVCLAAYLMNIYRIHRPLKELLDSVASESADRWKLDNKKWPADVKELAESMWEDQGRLAERIETMHLENEAVKQSHEAERRQWKRYGDWIARNHASVEQAVEGERESHNLHAQGVRLLEEVKQEIERWIAEQKSATVLAEGSARMVLEIREKQDIRIQKVINLVKKFDDIDETMRRIHAITDQTKIISFNAGIEASSGVDAGKRFSIVASDMRKLAQNIEDAYDAISATMRHLKTGLNDVVGSALEGGAYVNRTGTQLHELVPTLKGILDHALTVQKICLDLQAVQADQADRGANVLAHMEALAEANGEMRALLKQIEQPTHFVPNTNLTDRSVS